MLCSETGIDYTVYRLINPVRGKQRRIGISLLNIAEYDIDAPAEYQYTLQVVLLLTLRLFAFRSEAALRVSMALHAAQHNECISAWIYAASSAPTSI